MSSYHVKVRIRDGEPVFAFKGGSARTSRFKEDDADGIAPGSKPETVRNEWVCGEGHDFGTVEAAANVAFPSGSAIGGGE